MPLPNIFENLTAASDFLKLIGNDKRLEIVRHLSQREMTVGEIARKIAISPSATSQHLSKLRAGGLATVRRDRQMALYSIDSEAVQSLLRALDALPARESLPRIGRAARP